MFRRSFLAGIATTFFPMVANGNTKLPRILELDRSILKWPRFANDLYGCCVVSSCAQAIRIWTEANKQPYEVPDQYIIQIWAKLNGFKANDKNPKHLQKGLYVSDMLDQWIDGWEIGLKKVSYLIDYAEINRNDLSIKMAVDLFGGCLLTFQCPEHVMHKNISWCDLGNTKGKRKYGHAVYVVGYNDNFQNCDGTTGALKVISWGYHHYVSWKFVNEYADRAIALLGQEWVPNGMSPNGHSQQSLQNVIDFVNLL